MTRWRSGGICLLCLVVQVVTGGSLVAANRIFVAGTRFAAAQYQITADRDNPAVLFAAGELQKFLFQLTGEQAPINPGKKSPCVISLVSRDGDTGDILKNETFTIRIRTDGNILLEGGGNRGAIYAVFTFLEKYLDVHWYYPGAEGETLPRDQIFRLRAGTYTEKPGFLYRGFHACFYNPGPTEEEVLFFVRNKINYITFPGFINADKGGMSIRPASRPYYLLCQDFQYVIPPSEYGAQHPEYFSLLNGTRLPSGTASQICTSNPDVQRITLARVLTNFERNPGANSLGLSGNDVANAWCECPECQELGKPNAPDDSPNIMDRLLAYINPVAREVQRRYPGHFITTLSYIDAMDPPRKIIPEDNVFIYHCHLWPAMCQSHPVETCAINDHYRATLEGWTRVARNMLFYEYSMNSPGSRPFPVLKATDRDLKFYCRLGLKGGHYEIGRPENALGWLNMPQSYLVTRLLWDPKLTWEEVMKGYCRDLFGEGAEPMRKYYALLEKEVADRNIHLTIYTVYPNPPLFIPNVTEKCWKYFDEALQLTRDNPLAAERIRAVQSRFASVVLEDAPVYASWDRRYLYLNHKNGAAEKKEVLIGRYEIVSLENGDVRAEVIPGLGGRIHQLTDKKKNVKLFYTPEFINAKGDHYLDLGGYEEYSTSAHASEGSWENYRVTSRTPEAITMEADLDNGFLLKRTVSFTGRSVRISSELKNVSGQACTTVFRVHPELSLGRVPGVKDTLLVKKENAWRSLAMDTLQDRYLRGTELPAGEWQVRDKARGLGVINRFPADQVATCYFCSTDNFYTWELMSKPVALQPGESFSFSHTYELFDLP